LQSDFLPKRDFSFSKLHLVHFFKWGDLSVVQTLGSYNCARAFSFNKIIMRTPGTTRAAPS
jgi:hypothetical protein